jgi:hypothetical protein
MSAGATSLFDDLVTDLLRSGEVDVESWSMAEVEEAAFLLATLMAAPAQALWAKRGELDPFRRPVGRGEEYFLAIAMAIRISLPRWAGRGHPRDILHGLRAFQEAWHVQLQALREAPEAGEPIDLPFGAAEF